MACCLAITVVFSVLSGARNGECLSHYYYLGVFLNHSYNHASARWAFGYCGLQPSNHANGILVVLVISKEEERETFNAFG